MTPPSLAPFRLAVLGTPEISRSDGIQVTIDNPIMLQLLALMLLNPQRTFLRRELCALFYPEHESRQAEQNLRQTIHRLRKVVDDTDDDTALLLREPYALRVNPARAVWVDALAFNALISSVQNHPHRRLTTCPHCLSRLDTAVGLYRDTFMCGVPLVDELEEWAFVQRTTLTRNLLFALHTLTTHASERGSWTAAQVYLDRWLALDTLDEDAIALQMYAFAQQGQRLLALQLFEKFTALLNRRLCIDPSRSLTELAEQIIAERWEVTPPTGSPKISFTARSSVRLPVIPPDLCNTEIPFFGRAGDLNGILDRLGDNVTRLITVTGMGGIGKTRLALQATQIDAANWSDGVIIVALHNAPDLHSGLLAALNLPIGTGAAASGELYRYLRDKEVLLMLDHLDQLPDPRHAIRMLLFHAPKIRILSTSRQRLGIAGEISIHLGGLPYPSATDPTKIMAESSSVQFFLGCAQAFHPALDLTDQLPAIAAISRLVYGFPLLLVLAAQWTHALSCAEIAKRIAADSDFLKDHAQHLPVRQHSLRMVFNASWVLLSPPERRHLQHLAIFDGAFTIQQAETVHNVQAEVVNRLYEKSLLETVSPAQFQVHPFYKQLILESEALLSPTTRLP